MNKPKASHFVDVWNELCEKGDFELTLADIEEMARRVERDKKIVRLIKLGHDLNLIRKLSDAQLDRLQPKKPAGRRKGKSTDGQQLKAARKKLGLTQRQLARKVGVSVDTIQRAESGHTVSTLDLITAALKK
jgi:DNA-binding XRE family transcriptional regulator